MTSKERNNDDPFCLLLPQLLLSPCQAACENLMLVKDSTPSVFPSFRAARMQGRAKCGWEYYASSRCEFRDVYLHTRREGTHLRSRELKKKKFVLSNRSSAGQYSGVDNAGIVRR